MAQLDRRTLLGLVIGSLIAAARQRPALAADGEAELWSAMRKGEAIAMMRHALAPGTGDPADFQIDDCATQRNLSDTGREQARTIGARFRANGIERAEVRSSQWCRCLETAELLDLGPVEALPALNSFFRNRAAGPEQTRTLQKFLRERDGTTPLVLVTHQVNITALTGVFPGSGEIVVVERSGRGVAGTIATDPAG